MVLWVIGPSVFSFSSFSLVVQRTKLIDAAQDILLSLLEQLTTGKLMQISLEKVS